MISTIIRNTFTTIVLAAFATLAIPTAHASEVTGVLNPSGTAPTPSETSTPASSESETHDSGGEVSGSSNASTPEHAPVAANTHNTEAERAAPAPGAILSSYTDTTNVPAKNSFVEDTLPRKDPGNFAILHDEAVASTLLAANTGAESSTNIFGWWWAAFSFFVITVLAGLYVYRPRYNEKRWIERQY